MTDSPPSEFYEHGELGVPRAQPVLELDDHRNQPQSIPRANTMESHTHRPTGRRGTLSSVVDRPDLLSPSESQGIQWNDVRVRDFPENAIDDDGKSIDSSAGARRGSSIARRNTFRQAHEQGSKHVSKSRTSSTSTRSISPPNSVDAFASARRRDRSGTVRSHAPSENDLHRTISGGTHRRRPTFSDNRSVDSRASTPSSVEEDVCYPQEDDVSGKKGPIDFEELDEFFQEQREKTAVERALRSPVVNGTSGLPQISVHAPTPSIRLDNPLDEETVDDVEAEKQQAQAQADMEAATTATLRTFGESQRKEVKPFWTFFSSELDDAIYSSSMQGLLADGETACDLFHLEQPEEGMWWLDCLNPSEDEVTVLCKAFGVHPLTREDIVTQEAREKVELFRRYYFVSFRSFEQMDKDSEDFLEPVNVYAVVFRQGLLTFTFSISPHAANVRKRIAKLRDYMKLSADWVCYALIDDIVDSFAPVIHEIETETDSIEDEVFKARPEDSRLILKSIGDCRKKVMSLLRLLGGKADVIKGFAKRCNESFDVAPRQDVGMYLSDVQDHVVTMINNLSHFEKILSRSHANYLAQISVDNLSQGNQVQETLGKVTLIATILVPLNLITGLFGMNVNVPGKDTGGLGWFFGIIGIIAAFVLTCLLVAKRKKMI